MPVVLAVDHYYELSGNVTGGVGLYPFHKAWHKNFGVHEKGNYWRCFADCGGGSIIDFWMKWKNLDLGEATKELAEMLEVE